MYVYVCTYASVNVCMYIYITQSVTQTVHRGLTSDMLQYVVVGTVLWVWEAISLYQASSCPSS